MKHTISVSAQDFAQSLKDARAYAARDENPRNAMNNALLTLLPKNKKLAIIACDGLGYYERRLNLIQPKGGQKPGLPENRLFIDSKDCAMLASFIPAREKGCVTLELDDAKITDGNYLVKLCLSNGVSTTFFSRSDLEMPDYGTIRANAEKGKKKAPVLANVHIPVNEMLRAGKVFPGKKAFAQIFTAKGIRNGLMALLECKSGENDISVIFMLSEQNGNAA